MSAASSCCQCDANVLQVGRVLSPLKAAAAAAEEARRLLSASCVAPGDGLGVRPVGLYGYRPPTRSAAAKEVRKDSDTPPPLPYQRIRLEAPRLSPCLTASEPIAQGSSTVVLESVDGASCSRAGLAYDNSVGSTCRVGSEPPRFRSPSSPVPRPHSPVNTGIFDFGEARLAQDASPTLSEGFRARFASPVETASTSSTMLGRRPIKTLQTMPASYPDIERTVPTSTAKELRDLEDRLKQHISQVWSDFAVILERSEKKIDVSVTHLGQKVANYESAKANSDRKVSEMQGALQGITAEAFSLSQCNGLVEARLSEFQKQIENSNSVRCEQIEKNVEGVEKDVASAKLHMHEQSSCISSIEEKFGNLAKCFNEDDHRMSNISSRLAALENQRSDEQQRTESQCRQYGQQAADSEDDFFTRMWQVERQLESVTSKTDRLEQEARGDRGWDSRLEEHEVRIQGLRAKLDSQEIGLTAFSDRSRCEWEARFQQLRQLIQERNKEWLANASRVDAIERWAVDAKHALERVCQMCNETMQANIFEEFPLSPTMDDVTAPSSGDKFQWHSEVPVPVAHENAIVSEPNERTEQSPPDR